MEGESVSQDPTDRLIRELIRTRREATTEEVEWVIDRIAAAPFMGEVRVPTRDRGLSYQGRTVGTREDSLFYHLAKRVSEGQWRSGTTETEYLRDLRDAVSAPEARLVVYALENGNVAAVLTGNSVPETRLGDDPEAYVFVVYSANRGRIFSGYQASSIETINVSETPLWLR